MSIATPKLLEATEATEATIVGFVGPDAGAAGFADAWGGMMSVWWLWEEMGLESMCLTAERWPIGPPIAESYHLKPPK